MSLFTSPGTTGRMAAIRLKSANKHIFRALLSLASAALLIRVGGMFNQMVVSAQFGAGTLMDAYFVASTLPLLLAQLIGGSIEAAVIPVYARLRLHSSREQVSRLFSTLLNGLLLGTSALMVVMLWFNRQLILLSAPGLGVERTNLASSLAPFIYPALLLSVVIGFLECILNTEGQFGWPAYAGLLVPLSTALLVLIAGKTYGVLMLCAGTLAGLGLQLGVFIFRAWRAKLVYRPVIDIHHRELGPILRMAWPVLLGALISQGSPLVDQIFASSLSAGSISALSYALKLVSVFSGVIFVSVGRAVLPYLSRQAALRDTEGYTAFKETLKLYLWAISLGTTALSVVTLLLARPLVQLLFQRGAFSAAATDHTTTTLIGFLVGLTPMALGFVTSKAFSALGKTQVLMRVTIFSVAANALFDYVFAHFWQSLGIALATSLVYLCTSIILLLTLRRTIGTLHLFTPPGEIVGMIKKAELHDYYQRCLAWKKDFFNPVGSSPRRYRQLLRAGITLVVFVAGMIGTLHNSLYTARIAAGSLVVLLLLRYQYALLIVWALLNVYIGSALPFFNGLNLDSGLTVSTLLLLAFMPVGQIFKRVPGLTLQLVYLLWVLLGIGISPIGTGPFLTLWFTLLDYVAIAALTITLLTSRKRLLGLIDAMMLPALFAALYGIYGYITRQNGDLDPATSLFRVHSIFTPAATFALYLSVMIPPALYRTFSLKGWRRIVYLLITLCLLTALLLTFTRGAYICVLLSLILLALCLPSRRLKLGILGSLMVLAALTFLLASMGALPIFGRFFSQDVATLNGRTYLWQALLSRFDPSQLLGNGLEASDTLLAYLRIGTNGQGIIGTAPHNLYLGTLYDHGIIGLILLVATFLALGVSLLMGIRRTRGERRMLFATALATLISMVVQSFESRDIWIQAVGIYFWIVMALPFANCWFVQSSLSMDEKMMADQETLPLPRAVPSRERALPSHSLRTQSP